MLINCVLESISWCLKHWATLDNVSGGSKAFEIVNISDLSKFSDSLQESPRSPHIFQTYSKLPSFENRWNTWKHLLGSNQFPGNQILFSAKQLPKQFLELVCVVVLYLTRMTESALAPIFLRTFPNAKITELITTGILRCDFTVMKFQNSFLEFVLRFFSPN